jgi:hypothetical protein
MAPHTDMIFRVTAGRVHEDDIWSSGQRIPPGEEFWSDIAGAWLCWTDTSGEFMACHEGWYHQWRCRKDDYDVMGEPIGPMHGPYATRGAAEAALHAKGIV